MKNTIVNINGVPTVQVSDPTELDQFVVIDVRRPDEYTGELGHIKGAKLITLGPDLDTYLSNGNKNDKILFICRSGMRSANATLSALNFGYQNVFNMEGGMLLWNQKNFPTV